MARIDLGLVKGKDGKTLTLNGITPDVNGNIELKASDVGACSSEYVDNLLEKKPNPNLLHNWYFPNAVNQRGFSGSASAVYTYLVDRWRIGAVTGSGHVDFNGGVITVFGSAGYANIRQAIDDGLAETVIGKTVTESVLFSNNTLVSKTFVVEANNMNAHYFGNEHSYLCLDTRTSDVYFAVLANGEDLGIVAVKLELGSDQTLASKDSAGNWVLNEIPDFGDELLKCIQSTADPNDTYANKTVATTVWAAPAPTISQTDITAGSTALATGKSYHVYE